jgi:transposase-like protein
VLVAVRLGQRERHEDWLGLGRDPARRGLRAPWLVVPDGAPGLVKAIRELWPGADRQRCTAHRLRNILAEVPNRPELHERIKSAYWAAPDDAVDPTHAEQRWRQVVTSPEPDYPSAAACLAEDLPAPVRPPQVFPASARALPLIESAGAFARGGPSADQGDRPLPR